VFTTSVKIIFGLESVVSGEVYPESVVKYHCSMVCAGSSVNPSQLDMVIS